MAAKTARKCSRDNSTCGDSLKTTALAGSLKKLSGNDLLKRLKTFRGSELAVLLEILRCLSEVKRRRLYVPHGYGSLYDLCTDYLKYSRTAAWRRIHAARCIERFPQVAGLLRSGELSLTVVSMISRILTKENAEEIISYARGKSTRDVEMLVSRHRPGFMLRDRVRPVCLMVPDVTKNDSCRISGAGKNSTQQVDINILKNQGVHQGAGSTLHNGAAAANVSSIPDPGDAALAVTAVSAECKVDSQNIERVLITQKFKLEFAVDPAFMEKLARTKSLLSTKYPKDICFEKIFNILMIEYLDRHSPESRIKKRAQRRENKKDRNIAKGNGPGELKNPEKKRTGAGRTRHIPQSIRDEVFVRDGGKRTFISNNGKRCVETRNLQIDHIVPYAKGGDNSPGNLRLLCPAHNRLEAEKAYGRGHMDKFYRRE